MSMCVLVTQPCPTLYNHMDYTPPSSSLSMEFSRIREWVAIFSSGGLFNLATSPILVISWCDPTRFLCPWDFTGKNTRVGCHFSPQGMLLTQGSTQGLLHCRQFSSVQFSHSVVPDSL